MIPVEFPYELRFEHCFIPGGTGHGKSTILQIMALQDILNGAGITFIDPGGDAVKHLVNWVPENRKDDAYYLDMEHPVPFDFLSHQGPTERDELVKDLTFIVLKGISNAPRAESILIDLWYTLLQATVPVSFLDAYYFLTEPGRRKEILLNHPDEKLKYRWENNVPKDEHLQPITTRLTPFVRNSSLQTLFGAVNPKLNIAHIMNTRKILFVDLGGASSAAIEYGALLFAKMRQEVFRRHIQPKRERIPHFLFVDEFQEFPNPDEFSRTLKMARKYMLSCTLATPTYHDLDPKIKSALGIISNFIILKLAPDDLSFFSHIVKIEQIDPRMLPIKKEFESRGMKWEAPGDEYSLKRPEDLLTMPKYHAYYKIGDQHVYKKNHDPIPLAKVSYAQYIKKRTVDTYACNTVPASHTESNVRDPNSGDEIKPDPNPPGHIPPHRD